MILFLDFDGVLHPSEVYMVKGKPELLYEGELFMWVYHLEQILEGHLDVKIVLSTTWARRLGFQRAKGYLPASLQKRVIGATWHSAMKWDDESRPMNSQSWWDNATRYQQIAGYIERAKVQEWVAIDDDDAGWPESERHRLVYTKEWLGLGDPEARERLNDILEN